MGLLAIANTLLQPQVYFNTGSDTARQVQILQGLRELEYGATSLNI